MHTFRRVLLMLSVAVGASYQTAFAPPAAKVADIAPRFDSKTLTFRHPRTGHIFSLHLGEQLYHDTGGITEVPSNIKLAMRDATSSYYEPQDKDGGGYAAAESLYTRDQADLVARNTSIQYQSDSGRLLITEDKSDGTPDRRYILYTPFRLGYRVTYLMPGYTKIPNGNPIDTIPADIRLLRGDRAEIKGKTVKITDIPQSTHPFSVGG